MLKQQVLIFLLQHFLAIAPSSKFLLVRKLRFVPFFGVFMLRRSLIDPVQPVGYNLALTSRLIPRTSFNNATSRSSLVTAFTTANNLLPSFLILIVAPSSFPGDGMTSVTDAWRSSIYHVTVAVSWSWNATIEDKKAQYSLASSAMDDLRKLTPDAAYVVRTKWSTLWYREIIFFLLSPSRTKQMSMSRTIKVSVIQLTIHSLVSSILIEQIIVSGFLGRSLFPTAADQTEIVRIKHKSIWHPV